MARICSLGWVRSSWTRNTFSALRLVAPLLLSSKCPQPCLRTHVQVKVTGVEITWACPLQRRQQGARWKRECLCSDGLLWNTLSSHIFIHFTYLKIKTQIWVDKVGGGVNSFSYNITTNVCIQILFTYNFSSTCNRHLMLDIEETKKNFIDRGARWNVFPSNLQYCEAIGTVMQVSRNKVRGDSCVMNPVTPVNRCLHQSIKVNSSNL